MTASAVPDLPACSARAQRILDGEAPMPPLGPQPPDAVHGVSPESLQGLVRDLKSALDFGRARQLLEHAPVAGATMAQRTWVVQQRALATYKDEELAPGFRLTRALTLLETVGLNDPLQEDRETLCLGGAVYKRRWEVDGQLEHLHASVALYQAAWDRGDPQRDVDGRLYGAVNAAFVLDLLAERGRRIAHRTGTSGHMAHAQAMAARALRAQALDVALAQRHAHHAQPPSRERDPPGPMPEPEWWAATIGQLHFGLEQWDEAAVEFREVQRRFPPDDWRLQATAKQLVALARVMPAVPPPPEGSQPRETWPRPWQALGELFGVHAAPALQGQHGKVGLALSGGGFRASLFHLGVLARLAECDVLRSVEVVSCVSGGSIVGAHWYLALRQALQQRTDAPGSRDTYVALVREVMAQFTAGVSENLRMRALSSLRAALRGVFDAAYTRSRRLGELYDEVFYAQVHDRPQQPPRRRMRDLLIHPAGEAPNFKPRFMNWRRHTKVPVLLLNATSLNSGHNWQFTGRWMGEPPENFGAGIDMNTRYRRLWWDDAPTPALRDLPLGDAVAASACVPGLFEPLVLDGLYPGRTLRLVDGGVHDNQGVQGLLGESCTIVFCSDASGQMDDLERPSDGRLGVPLRANGILMDRVREAQYQDLRSRVASRSLQGLFFVHLKQGLDASALDWTGCPDPTPTPVQPLSTTPYGMDKTLQRQLAGLRTDLDSFSEIETQLLMLSGYLMTEYQLRCLQAEHEDSGEAGTWGGFDVHAPRGDWSFLALEPLARLPPDAPDLRRREIGRLVGAGSRLFFRIWTLDRALSTLALVVAAAVAVGGIAWVARHWEDRYILGPLVLDVGKWVLAGGLFLAGLVLPVLKWLNPRETMRSVLTKIGIAVAGVVFANIHLLVFDKLFLRLGKVRRVMRLP